jgi:amino acid transporter
MCRSFSKEAICTRGSGLAQLSAQTSTSVPEGLLLSTTVIQGIVPNAELARSTGHFGLACVHMFNPTIGSVIMALAVMACLGSLLGWQFTIAMTGKSAADDRMFPTFFTKVNRMGAPITSMIVMGVVQTGLAPTTISPTLSEQRSLDRAAAGRHHLRPDQPARHLPLLG